MKLFFRLLPCLLCVLLFGNELNAFSQEQENVNNERKLIVDRANVYFNDNLLSNDEVEAAMKDQPQALELYQKGYDLRKKGTILLVGGIVGSVAGFGLMVGGVETTTNNYGQVNTKINSNYMLGLLVSAVSEGMLAGGIVCRIVGRSKIGKSVKQFNSSVSANNAPNKYNMTLSFRPSEIGLTLNF